MTTDPESIARFAINPNGGDFAIGDIHGEFQALQAAMVEIGFNEARDRLFCVGGLVDRGPNSDLVLTWLDKPFFFCVRGNHDFMA